MSCRPCICMVGPEVVARHWRRLVGPLPPLCVCVCACVVRTRGCVFVCVALPDCRCELRGRGRGGLEETGLGRAPQSRSSSGDGRGCRSVAGIGALMTNVLQFTGDCFVRNCLFQSSGRGRCRRRYLLRRRDCAVSGSCRNKWPGPRRLWVSVSVLFYPGRRRSSRAGWDGLGAWAGRFVGYTKREKK